MEKTKALELLRTHVKNENLVKHCLASEAVMRALAAKLPGEQFLYLGDTARLPYGTKSADTVRRYALQAAHALTRQGVKLVVIACNTVGWPPRFGMAMGRSFIPSILPANGNRSSSFPRANGKNAGGGRISCTPMPRKKIGIRGNSPFKMWKPSSVISASPGN